MHGLSVRCRVPKKVHYWENNERPICNSGGARKDNRTAWLSLKSKRCMKCQHLLNKRKEK